MTESRENKLLAPEGMEAMRTTVTLNWCRGENGRGWVPVPVTPEKAANVIRQVELYASHRSSTGAPDRAETLAAIVRDDGALEIVLDIGGDERGNFVWITVAPEAAVTQLSRVLKQLRALAGPELEALTAALTEPVE